MSGHGPGALGRHHAAPRGGVNVAHESSRPECAAGGGGGGTYLALGQGPQMLQDLSHHRLTQLVVFGQKLGVSPVEAVVGVD